MTWDTINGIVGILAVSLTIFLEWPRVKEKFFKAPPRSVILVEKINWNFFLTWVLSGATGTIIATILLFTGSFSAIVHAYLSICMIQAVILRKYIYSTGWWLYSSIISLALFWIMFFAEYYRIGFFAHFANILIYLIFLIPLSVQWLILRRQVKFAIIWPIVSILVYMLLFNLVISSPYQSLMEHIFTPLASSIQNSPIARDIFDKLMKLCSCNPWFIFITLLSQFSILFVVGEIVRGITIWRLLSTRNLFKLLEKMHASC